MVQDSPRSFLMLLWNSLFKSFQSSRLIQVKLFGQSTTVFRCFRVFIQEAAFFLPSYFCLIGKY